MKEQEKTNEEKIIEVIEQIKPYLNDDGGNIEFIKYSDDTVFVKLTGACGHCAYRDNTIDDFVLRTIQNEVPSVKEVINVEI